MKTDQFRNNYGYVWLNVASRPHVLEDFLSLDNNIFLILTKFYPVIKFLLKNSHREKIISYRNANKKAKILLYDCRKPLKFPDDSIDHILCSHFLEHVYVP